MRETENQNSVYMENAGPPPWFGSSLPSYHRRWSWKYRQI